MGNTASFEEMSQRWRAVSNTVSDLTGPRFELQTSLSGDERVTARPTGRSSEKVKKQKLSTMETSEYDITIELL